MPSHEKVLVTNIVLPIQGSICGRVEVSLVPLNRFLRFLEMKKRYESVHGLVGKTEG
jgi:hypothetical protein